MIVRKIKRLNKLNTLIFTILFLLLIVYQIIDYFTREISKDRTMRMLDVEWLMTCVGIYLFIRLSFFTRYYSIDVDDKLIVDDDTDELLTEDIQS
jgi:hypothetical protein